MPKNTDKVNSRFHNNKISTDNTSTTGHVIKAYPGREYAVIPNSTLEDENLGDSALAILAYLVGKPSDWTIIVTDLMRRFRRGENKIYKTLKELENAGYLRRTTIRGANGKIKGVVSEIANEPIFATNSKLKPQKSHTPINSKPTDENHNEANNRHANEGAYKVNKNTNKQLLQKPDQDLNNIVEQPVHTANSGVKQNTEARDATRTLATRATPNQDIHKGQPEKQPPRAPDTPKMATESKRVAFNAIPPEILHNGTIEERLEFIGIHIAEIRRWKSKFGDMLDSIFASIKDDVISLKINVNNTGALFRKRLERAPLMFT